MRRSLSWLLSALLGALLLLPTAPAHAHGGHISPTQTFTQDIGPYELAITVEMPAAVPGPLYLIVTPQGDIGEATLTIQAVPRGFPLEGAPVAEVRTFPGSSLYYAELAADRAGDWELAVRVAGARGTGQARIPFAITPAPIAPLTIPLALALGGAVALMIVSLAAAGIAKSRARPVPALLDRLLGYAIFACLISAGVFGVQQFLGQTQAAAEQASAPAGRPHVNVALRSDPAQPAAGQPFTLTLDLSDGSTGLPVDDLLPHHDALIHLVLIDDSGAAFRHLHPASVVPGRFAIELTLDRAGGYTAYAEIERRDSGTQVIARRFEVTGAAASPAADAAGLGLRSVDGLEVDLTSSLTPLRAGRQATLTLSISAGGEPVTDISPWLGMAGHLITRSADGDVFGHIHAVGPMASATTSLEQIAPPSYGPDIRFVYTFPQAGRYHLWAQFQRAGQIYTVPVLLEVGE